MVGLVFIWGTKGSVAQIGYLVYECPSCKTGDIFAVHQAKKKFTLYFVPTFSYSNKQYLECLSCHASYEVPNEMKPLVEQNLLSQEELSALIERVNAEEPDVPELEHPTTPALVSGPNVVCHSCGEPAVTASRFCSACGAELQPGPLSSQTDQPLEPSTIGSINTPLDDADSPAAVELDDEERAAIEIGQGGTAALRDYFSDEGAEVFDAALGGLAHDPQ